jgi:DNA invertase Pin-like site-specific DNA recombinase
MSGRFAGKRVALYARYSSANQRDASVEEQLERCRNYVMQNGGQVDDRLEFSDRAMSGTTLHRPDMQRLLAAIEAGLVDAVVTEESSRISRDIEDSGHLFKLLQHRDVPLIGVADGVDTSAPHSKMHFMFMSLKSDMYVVDLSDKTRRGQAGRWNAGLSTGGQPYGYKSTPVHDTDGRTQGYRIEIDKAQASVVTTIFELYAQGQSLTAIAKKLTASQVPPPRAKTRHRQKGWIPTTIRSMLENAMYIGRREWRKKKWVRDPTSGKRRPVPRVSNEVLHQDVPNLRIIDEDLWNDVRDLAAAVRAQYTGQPHHSGRGNMTRYPLSGLLVCGKCGTTMTIMRGSSASYYRCDAHRKRNTCDNSASVREESVRRCVFEAIAHAVFTPAAIEHMRKAIALRLGEMMRQSRSEIDERTAQLTRINERIQRFLTYIATTDMGNGDSFSVRDALRDLEDQKRVVMASIKSLQAANSKPVALPSADQILARAQNLMKVLEGEPMRAREALRRLFRDGQIRLCPQADRTYVAEGRFLPLVAIAETKKSQEFLPGISSLSSVSCAGRI